MNFKENIKEKIKGLKIIDNNNINPNIIIIILLSILVLIISNSFDFSDESTTFSNQQNNEGEVNSEEVMSSIEIETYETNIENKLKETLENIQGVGNVNVNICFKGGEEQVPALNVNGSDSTTEEDDGEGGTRTITQKTDGETIVMKDDGSITEPYIIKSYNPKIEGVVIVAQGASDDFVKLQIQEAVITLFGVSENEVTVYPMKK
ncbi:stage III sporulation protein AG [Clostridium sp. DL1XJH146]